MPKGTRPNPKKCRRLNLCSDDFLVSRLAGRGSVLAGGAGGGAAEAEPRHDDGGPGVRGRRGRGGRLAGQHGLLCRVSDDPEGDAH